MATKLKRWQMDSDGRVATNCGGPVADPGEGQPERAEKRNRHGRVFVNAGEAWQVLVKIGSKSFVVAEGTGGAAFVRVRHETGGTKPADPGSG